MELIINMWKIIFIVFVISSPDRSFRRFASAQQKCQTLDYNEGYCLPRSKCIGYVDQHESMSSMNWPRRRSQCTQRGFICCDETQVDAKSFYGYNAYTSSLHPRGFNILSSMEKCGNTTFHRIAYGMKPKLGQFPWTALLVYNQNQKRCGGSLISTRYVLTAAHCFKRDLEVKSVILGEHNLNTNPDCERKRNKRVCMPPREQFGIEKIIRHPQYSAYQIKYDIGLIRLDREVQFKEHITPICLPLTPLTLVNPESFIVAGWGITESGYVSQILKYIIVEYMDPSLCVFRHAITSHNICASSNGPGDNCAGDSGGALFNAALYLPYQTHFIQYGIIASGGYNCSSLNKSPSLYTNVTEFMYWITSNLEE